ncbi:hypothetical protein ACFV2H_21090 [Streptomyces sp. NPDC059629]|uniref:hypothetical protein n=1 Tax=Streptomyces sp. NPDC059629 TaxID=3346889 RepID=UPI00367A0BEE
MDPFSPISPTCDRSAMTAVRLGGPLVPAIPGGSTPDRRDLARAGDCCSAFNHAKKLTEGDRIVLDDRDEWSERRPSAADENAYLDSRSTDSTRTPGGTWGIDDEMG